MTFEQAFERVIGHEGVLSLNPKDRGNWTTGRIGEGELKGTKYGIAAHAYPHLDIANLTLDDARAIYRERYWNKVRADELGPLAFDVFDAAVNHGTTLAAMFLQRAVGVKDDGIIGPITIAAAKKADPWKFRAKFNGERLDLYADLSTFPAFGRGWCRRIAANLRSA